MTRRSYEPLMTRLQQASRALDHISNTTTREGLRFEARMAQVFTAGLGTVLDNPRDLPAFIAAWLLDCEAWLDELERDGWVDMAPYHAAERGEQ